MAINGLQKINVGVPNQTAGSDSLYTAFTKTVNNFNTLFACASPFSTVVGNTGIGVDANVTSGVIRITNTGVTSIVAGQNINVSQINGVVTIASTAIANGNASITSSSIIDSSVIGRTLITTSTASTARTALELGTAALANVAAFATAAQGTKADSALQANTVVATINTQLGSNAWQSSSMTPSDVVTSVNTALGSTSWQAGPTTSLPVSGLSDSSVVGRSVLTSVDAPTARTALGLGSAATANTSAFATSAQGTKADSALQAADMTAHLNAADPHPIYLTQTEGDARYALIGSGSGGSALPTSIAYSNVWTTAGNFDSGTYTATTSLTLTSSDTNSVVGGSTAGVIIGGSNSVTFDGVTPTTWYTGTAYNFIALIRIGSVVSWFINGIPTAGRAVSAPVAPTITTAPIILGTPQVSVALAWTAGTMTGVPAPSATFDLMASDQTTVVQAGITNGSYSPTTIGTFYLRQTASNGVSPAATRLSASFTVAAAPTVPGSPSVTNAVSITSTGFTYTYADPASDGGSAITSRSADVSFDGGTTWTALTAPIVGSNTITFVATGSVRAAQVRARATNSVGNSAYGTLTGISVPAGTVPGSPAISGVTGISTTGLTYTFTDPSSNGGSPITARNADISFDGGTTWTALTTPVAGTNTITFSSSSSARTAQIRGRVTSLIGSSSYSTLTGVAIPATGTVPDAPTVSNATSITATSLTYTFADPVNNGGSAISARVADISFDSGTTWTALTAPVAGTNSITYASSGSARTAQIRARVTNTTGTSAYGTLTGISIPAVVGTTGPTNLRASNITGTNVTLTWDAAAAPPGTITEEHVEVSSDGGITWATVTFTATNPYTVTSGSSSAARSYRIRTYYSNSTNALSNVIVVTFAGVGQTSITGTQVGTTIAQTPYTMNTTLSGTVYTSTGAAIVGQWASGTCAQIVFEVANLSSTVDFVIEAAVTGASAARVTLRSNAVTMEYPQSSGYINASAIPASSSTTFQRGANWASLSSVIAADIWRFRLVSSRLYLDASIDRGANWLEIASTPVAGATIALGSNLTAALPGVAGQQVRITQDPVTTAPGAPENITLGTATISSQVINWTAPASNGGSVVTGYVVQQCLTSAYGDSGVAAFTTVATLGNVLTYTSTGLTAGTSYSYRVAAINAIGTSNSWSSIAAGSTATGVATKNQSTISRSQLANTLQLYWNTSGYSLNATSNASTGVLTASGAGQMNSFTEISGGTAGVGTYSLTGTTKGYLVELAGLTTTTRDQIFTVNCNGTDKLIRISIGSTSITYDTFGTMSYANNNLDSAPATAAAGTWYQGTDWASRSTYYGADYYRVRADTTNNLLHIEASIDGGATWSNLLRVSATSPFIAAYGNGNTQVSFGASGQQARLAILTA